MIGLIVARSRNNVIGKQGMIPWRIKGEQKQFRELTTRNIVIMGRKSYEEIGHPLPNRMNIIVSRTEKFEGQNLATATSLTEAIALANATTQIKLTNKNKETGEVTESILELPEDKNIYISGGYGLFKEGLPMVEKMFITEVDTEVEDGDTFFSDFDPEDFTMEIGETGGEEILFTRVTYTRKKLTEVSGKNFAKKLASKVSVPGGGGAAALAGAYGVALCSMAANFTTGKKKYAQYEEDIQRILRDGEEIRKNLIDLVEKDAAAFEPLSVAYGIPKEDPDRDAKLEEATLIAIQPPLQMMREIARSIELLEEMLVKGSVIMVSDVGCGAMMAKAALESASLNVFINTKALKNRDEAAKLNTEADELLKFADRAETVAKAVSEKLRNQ